MIRDTLCHATFKTNLKKWLKTNTLQPVNQDYNKNYEEDLKQFNTP